MLQALPHYFKQMLLQSYCSFPCHKSASNRHPHWHTPDAVSHFRELKWSQSKPVTVRITLPAYCPEGGGGTAEGSGWDCSSTGMSSAPQGTSQPCSGDVRAQTWAEGCIKLLGLHSHPTLNELACHEHTEGDKHTVVLFAKATTKGRSVFKNW